MTLLALPAKPAWAHPAWSQEQAAICVSALLLAQRMEEVALMTDVLHAATLPSLNVLDATIDDEVNRAAMRSLVQRERVRRKTWSEARLVVVIESGVTREQVASYFKDLVAVSDMAAAPSERRHATLFFASPLDAQQLKSDGDGRFQLFLAAEGDALGMFQPAADHLRYSATSAADAAEVIILLLDTLRLVDTTPEGRHHV